MNLGYVFNSLKVHIKGNLLNALQNDPLLEKNKKFKDLHKGERCFILGSGPSIMSLDLTPLANEYVMTQNHFHAHKDIAVIKPQYHYVVPKYQPSEYDDKWREWIQTMQDWLPPDTQFFFGKNTKYLVDEFPAVKDRSYYLSTRLQPMFMDKAYTELHKSVAEVHTAITACISIALYMGFKDIYLLGFDLDQFVNIDNRDKIRFYGNSPVTKTKIEEEIEQRFAKTGIFWFNYWLVWKQLNLLRRQAEERGGQIINATRGGILNVFERRVYEEVVKG